MGLKKGAPKKVREQFEQHKGFREIQENVKGNDLVGFAEKTGKIDGPEKIYQYHDTCHGRSLPQ